MSKFNIKLKELREEKRLSAKELSQALNITMRTIHRWESGQHVPDVDVIIAVAKFFEVTTDYLLGVED